MHINECLVRDGVGWSEQRLINDEGCPVDSEIMGQFEYSAGKTTALVRFQVRMGHICPPCRDLIQCYQLIQWLEEEMHLKTC